MPSRDKLIERIEEVGSVVEVYARELKAVCDPEANFNAPAARERIDRIRDRAEAASEACQIIEKEES